MYSRMLLHNVRPHHMTSVFPITVHQQIYKILLGKYNIIIRYNNKRSFLFLPGKTVSLIISIGKTTVFPDKHYRDSRVLFVPLHKLTSFLFCGLNIIIYNHNPDVLSAVHLQNRTNTGIRTLYISIM